MRSDPMEVRPRRQKDGVDGASSRRTLLYRAITLSVHCRTCLH